MIINTETHSWTNSERLWSTCPREVVFIIPPLKAPRSLQKRRWKDRKSQTWWTMEWSHPDTTGRMYTWTYRDCESRHKTCTGSNQTQSQHWEGRQTQGPTPNQEAICDWHLLGKGKSVFSNGVYWVQHRYSRAGSVPRSVRQHRMNTMVLMRAFGFVFVLFYFLFFVLLFLLWFLFFLFSRERKKSWSWVDREVGRIWEELVGKNMIKYIVWPGGCGVHL